jgi:excisionase family DNA binding protein
MEDDSKERKGLVPISTVARQLGLSKPHVYNLAKSGELPSIMFGKAVRFDPGDVERFIRAHRRKKGKAA